jgi:hypothetical protein
MIDRKREKKAISHSLKAQTTHIICTTEEEHTMLPGWIKKLSNGLSLRKNAMPPEDDEPHSVIDAVISFLMPVVAAIESTAMTIHE